MKIRSIAVILTLAGCPPAKTTTPTESKPAAPAAATTPAEAPLPAAEQVLQASIDALGGSEKIASLQSYYSETTTDIPAQSLTAHSKTWWKQGNFYTEVDMPGVGVTRMWRKGEDITSDDPINGRRKLEGAEARQAGWATSFNLPSEWKKYFDTATTKGRRESNGRKLVDVVLAAKDGTELTLSFDESTHALVERSFQQESPMGKLPIRITVVETQDFGGFEVPTKMSTSMAIMSTTDVVTKFEPNVAVDDAKFDPDAAKGKAIKAKAVKAGKPAAKTEK